LLLVWSVAHSVLPHCLATQEIVLAGLRSLEYQLVQIDLMQFLHVDLVVKELLEVLQAYSNFVLAQGLPIV
jgi:hypothetical protein